jgi:hypothetical protein
VRRLELNESGEYDVLLSDGTSLRLSRRYRKELQSRLGISSMRSQNDKSSAGRNIEDCEPKVG